MKILKEWSKYGQLPNPIALALIAAKPISLISTN